MLDDVGRYWTSMTYGGDSQPPFVPYSPPAFSALCDSVKNHAWRALEQQVEDGGSKIVDGGNVASSSYQQSTISYQLTAKGNVKERRSYQPSSIIYQLTFNPSLGADW